MILRPSSPLTESIATISIVNKTILTKLPEYNEKFRLVVKELLYTWESYRWQRIIDSKTGLIEDRLIELCYKLLQANFIIEISDQYSNLQDRILSGDFEPEQTRWLVGITNTQHSYTGWIAIKYDRYKENYYTKARALPGSRYSKPWVCIDPTHYEVLEFFAEKHSFIIDDNAKELLNKAKEKRKQQIRVELQPAALSRKEKISALAQNAPQVGEIADEFRDQD